LHGHFYKQSEKYVILYESSDENFQHENIEYPRDLKYILKAKYMSKCKKLFFKFHYGRFKLFQWILEKKCRFCEKILTKCLENYDGDDFYINEDQSCKKCFLSVVCTIFFNIVNLHESLNDLHRSDRYYFPKLILKSIFYIFFLYRSIAPYEAIFAILLFPLWKYSLKTAIIVFNVSPFVSFFWPPSNLYNRDLQEGGEFKMYPLEETHAIPTLKKRLRDILFEYGLVWLVTIVLTSFIYIGLPSCFSEHGECDGEW
jgi:hypothetical protein